LLCKHKAHAFNPLMFLIEFVKAPKLRQYSLRPSTRTLSIKSMGDGNFPESLF